MNKTWECSLQQCIESKCAPGSLGCFADGKCQDTCNSKPPSPSIGCIPQSVSPSCMTPTSPDDLYLEYLVQEYAPLHPDRMVNTFTDWLTGELSRCVEGDVFLFSTDYMSLGDFQENIRTALSNGVYILINNDRWQTCGNPLSGLPGPNTCSDCGAGGDSSCNAGGNSQCHCHLPQVGGCNSFYEFLSSLGYPANNYNGHLFIYDQGTDCDWYNEPEGHSAWTHAHRKVMNVYSVTRNYGCVYKGSQNIDAQNGGLGVRESGWGMHSVLNNSVIQYTLQLDLDYFTMSQKANESKNKAVGWPLYKITGQVKTVTLGAFDPAILQVLQNALVSPGKYPSLPITVKHLHWCAPDVTNDSYGSDNQGTISGVDQCVQIWLGVSPSPIDDKLFDPSSKWLKWGPSSDDYGVVYADGRHGDYYATIDYPSYISRVGGYKFPSNGQETRVQDGGTSCCGPYSDGCPNKCPEIEQLNVGGNFFKGATWAGSLIQLFFEKSIESRSKYLKISMYNPNFTAGAPCDDGGTFPGCDKVDRGNWFQNWLPIINTYLENYILATSDGVLQFTGGQYSPDQLTANPWLFQRFKQVMNPEQIDRVNFRWYNSLKNAQCNNKCGPGGMGCCRNHEKSYLSEFDVLLSSGHPTLGYYSDLRGINDDILFRGAFSLINFYNTKYQSMWVNSTIELESWPPGEN